MLESTDPQAPTRAASVAELAGIRAFLEQLAAAAGVADPGDLARKWHILMKGAIVAAAEGDREAAREAQDVARLLLAQA